MRGAGVGAGHTRGSACGGAGQRCCVRERDRVCVPRGGGGGPRALWQAPSGVTLYGLPGLRIMTYMT